MKGGGGSQVWKLCFLHLVGGRGGEGLRVGSFIFVYPFHETLITQKKKKKIMTVAISMILLNS